MAQFLIVVQVPEVEPLVAALRVRFDPSARRGLGAHITLLHSNLHSDRIDPTLVEQIAVVASAIAPFNYGITQVGRFPGILYLAAAPAAPFVLLSGRLHAALATGERQQSGREPLVPHVSVVRKSALDDREVEAELTGLLERHAPILCMCRQIELLENSSGLWRPVQEFALSGDTGNPWQAPS